MQSANKLLPFAMVSGACIKIAICIDILLILIFYAIGSPLLAWASVLSIFIYVIAYAFLTRQKIRTAACLICVEVLCHAGFGTCLVGWDGGFHYFILMGIPVILVSKTLWGGIWFVVPFWCLYIGMSISARAVSPLAPLEPFYLDLVRYLNATVVFAIFIYLFSFASRHVERKHNAFQEKLHKISQFSSEIAHELRTPLTALCNQGEIALRNPQADIDKKTRQFLESMLCEGFRLGRMIDRMLALAHIERSCIAVHASENFLEPIAKETLNIMQVMADEREIVLSLRGSGMVSAVVDPDFFQQILIDLLDNAIKYASAEVLIRVWQAGDYSFVEIIDDGPGILQENYDLMLRRFSRGNKSCGKKCKVKEGVGLGLAIAKSLTELQGGVLQLRNSSFQNRFSGLTVRLKFRASKKTSSC